MISATQQPWSDLGGKRQKRRCKQRKIVLTRTEKRCKDCGTIKPVSEFHASSRHSDGHMNRCKPCTAAYRFQLRPEPTGIKRGEDHYNAKLSAADVRLIKDLITERELLLEKARRISNRALADKFEVSKSTIERIANGQRWASA